MPSIIGTYHDRPLPYSIGNAPTLGQTGYIVVLTVLNIVFLTISYDTLWPQKTMQWYSNHYQELMAYWMWRTGALAFCQMPVLFLFSSRNNILLWLTNWSHSTYMLLHRWIARFFLLQTLLHSIISWVLYMDDGHYSKEVSMPLWYWGIVGTVAAVIIVLTSFLIIRQRAYELFLLTHIVMSVVCLVGCWYHVWVNDVGDFGYETFLYTTFAVWAFDRVARVGRILKTGMKRAIVTDIGPNIIRVDVPGIRWASSPGHCVYVYFPTLHLWKPWENHPFSMVPTAMITGEVTRDESRSESLPDTEKNQPVTVKTEPNSNNQAAVYNNSGLTIFVRKRMGMTNSLKMQDGLLTLVEGPYPCNPTKDILQTDRLLLIGGGIGITGLLPFIRCHPNVKIYHSVRADDQCLVDAIQPVLDRAREKHIVVGQRLDLDGILREEAGIGYLRIGVVMCGPAAMADAVRALVANVARDMAGRCAFVLEVDAFVW